MQAWIARDRNRTALLADEPGWCEGGYFAGSAIKAWTYEEFCCIFPGIELPMNHKRRFTLTASPAGEAVRGGEA